MYLQQVTTLIQQLTHAQNQAYLLFEQALPWLTICAVPYLGVGRLLHDEVTDLDLNKKQVICASGRPPIPYDILSINTGSSPHQRGIPGVAEHTLSIKPIDRFFNCLA